VSFLDKLNSPAVVAVVLVVFLILDGFLFYRYQQPLRSTANDASDAQVSEIAIETTSEIANETTSQRTTSAEEQNGVQVDVSVVNTPVGLSIQEDGQLVHD
jgi:cytoskeletal protein RodZ